MISIDFLNAEHARALDMIASSVEVRLAHARASYPIGTRVIYRPALGLTPEFEAVIRSVPWALSSGAVVVKINQCAGGVSVDHLTRIGVAAA